MNIQYNFRQNQPKQYNYQNSGLVYPGPSQSGVNLYSSLQAQTLIQPNSGNNYTNQPIFNITGSTSGIQTNDYGMLGRTIPNQGFVGQLNFASKSGIQNNKKYSQINNNMKNL